MVDSPYSGFGRYPLKYAALGLLVPGPKHGYGLYQDFIEWFGSIWKAGQTKFYLTLASLQDEGYLNVTTEPQENRPARKVYHLTDIGYETFLEWLHQPVDSMRSVRVEFIAKLRFFDRLKLPGAVALIDAQIAVLRDMLGEWERASGARAADPFKALVDGFRTRQARFMIEWLEAARPHFEAADGGPIDPHPLPGGATM